MPTLKKEEINEASSARNRRTGLKKGVYILPNLFTTASLFCGFYSIIRSISGDFVTAAWAIMIAGIFDGLDGRIARLTKSQSDFGLEYDSLVDVGSFGFAPALLIFNWSLHYLDKLGWMAAFLYVACGTLRLARFNVQASGVEKRFFQGLPIPLAAYTVASFVILHSSLGGDIRLTAYFLFPLTIILGLLMVSNVRYRSFKQIDFSKPRSFIFLVAVAVILVVIASAPDIMMFVVSLTYILLGLVEELLHLRQRKNFLENKLAQKEALTDLSKDHLKVVSLPSEEMRKS